MALMVHESSNPVFEKRFTIILKNHVKNERVSLVILPSTTCKKLHSLVSDKVRYVVGTFILSLNLSDTSDEPNTSVSIDEKDDHELGSIGFATDHKNRVDLKEKPGIAVELLCPVIPLENMNSLSSKIPDPPPLIPDNQLFGSTAGQRRNAVSTTSEAIGNIANNSAIIGGIQEISSTLQPSNSVNEDIQEMADLKLPKLVGLVNQAMTCYLNSLIQTLYMTPEFRNAMYKWICDPRDDKSTSIPYQLQHLFLLLQTSNKQSVETTGLTRSFGWDSSEAWQQHDIQELCRVMFDALEKKFEGTDQAQLIKQLYEGTMKDYVQCCECGHESARDDSFLDIPITIRPFGSNKTYKSVIEGLNAFVEPEVLDESNQYYCEKCDKKCDAKKGLKFTKFPYLLTLQLKRFDFDYTSMHRIKLNDRMSFSQVLNLNSFIDENETSLSNGNSFCDETEIPLQSVVDEDSSSHDSGHDYEQSSSTTTGAGNGDLFQCPPRNSSDEEEEQSSVDEGIDIEPSSSHKRRKSNSNSSWLLSDEAEAAQQYLKDGPYVYELFSVMVHSGSAAGGHYYAYIKSFEDGQWYSFNDQIVSPVTHLDIEKTYGGSPYSRTSSSYYSSFSSSTNAYMLMYRQIDLTKNACIANTSCLPSHILKLLEEQQEEERQLQIRLERERNNCSIRLFCRHSSVCGPSRTIIGETFEFPKDTTLKEAVEEAHKFMKLDPKVVPLGQCRLVKYDHISDVLDRSFDLDTEDANFTLSHLLGGPRTTYLFDLLLETREPNEVFERYERGGVTIKVLVVDHEKMSFHSPILLRSVESHTILQLKSSISKMISCPLEKLLVAYEKYSGDCRLLHNNKNTLKQEGFFKSGKVFVDALSDEEEARVNVPMQIDFRFEDTFLWEVIDRIANIISINITLPAELSDDHHPKETTENDSVPASASPKPDPNNMVSSSSDEGVGSLGCGNDSASTSKNGDVESSSPSHNPNSPDEKRNKTQDSDMTANEINCFWKIPETTGGSSPAPPNEQEEYKGERKRNNSYDDDAPYLPDVGDLRDKLQERLEVVVTAVSPTSSLRCEDSGSSHSGQNSFITDIDFEGVEGMTEDDSRETMQSAGPAGSEGGSLSTSCSTLDSTDTLCNTKEPRKFGTDEDYNTSSILPPDYNSLFVNGTSACKPASQNTATDSANIKTDLSQERFKPIFSNYPGRAAQVTTTGVKSSSDYNKALRYAEFSSEQPPPYKTLLRGTGDPSDSNTEPEKTAVPTNNIITSEPTKCNTAGDTTAPAQCKDSASKNNGGLINFCSAPNTICDSCSSAPDLPPSYDHPAPDPASDPDSGEGMDKLKPLFSDSNNSVNSGPLSNLTSIHATNQNPPNVDTGHHRERTVSSSSIASDGWGMTSELLQKHDYFTLVSSSPITPASTETSSTSSSRVVNVEIDKRMTLLGLKRHIVPLIGTPTRRFCVYRQYAGGQETEVYTPTDDFHLISDGSSFIVRFGRALRKDEYRCKLYQLALDEEETAKPFMSWVVQRGMSIKEARAQLIIDIVEQCAIQAEPSRIRIRKKTWKTPGQIYLPEDVFGTDISLYGSLEFFIEFLRKPEEKVKRNDLVLFTRRWFPSELRFGDFEEVVINEEDEDMISYLGYSLELLTKRITEFSGIPQEHVRVAKGRGIFPYRISVLYAESELEWLPSPNRSHPFHIADDGVVVFYKDEREPLKECSDEERQKFEKEERKYDYSPTVTHTSKYMSNSNLSSPSKPAYRRERALKIYTVDTTPSTKSVVNTPSS